MRRPFITYSSQNPWNFLDMEVIMIKEDDKCLNPIQLKSIQSERFFNKNTQLDTRKYNIQVLQIKKFVESYFVIYLYFKKLPALGFSVHMLRFLQSLLKKNSVLGRHFGTRHFSNPKPDYPIS